MKRPKAPKVTSVSLLLPDLLFHTKKYNARAIQIKYDNCLHLCKISPCINHLTVSHSSLQMSHNVILFTDGCISMYINQWIHGQGLQNTLTGLEKLFRHRSEIKPLDRNSLSHSTGSVTMVTSRSSI